MLSFLVHLLRMQVRRLYHATLTRIEWNVGVASAKDVDPLTCAEAKSVRWLPRQRRKQYLADPFVVRSGDKILLLAETLEPKDQRGVIVAYEATQGRACSFGAAIEDTEVHLSYPYLFRWRGDIYCVPERAEAAGIVLYRAVDFPKRWEPVSVILPGVRAIDPTLFRHGSYWWLTYTEAGLDSNSRLMLWYASEPTTVWMPHARNPVKIDPRSSRGAGTPFVYDGRLVRPAQDCSVDYGAKIVFNHIITITPTEFEERTIGELRPDPSSPYPCGIHTISLDGDLLVIDG